jgi:hypothetical protein
MVRPTTVSTNSLTNEAGGRLTVGGTIDLIGNTNNLAQLDINAPAGSGAPGVLWHLRRREQRATGVRQRINH